MAVIDVARPRAARLPVRAIGDWLAARWEVAWVVPLIVVAGIAHGWNMFDFPYYENDEGTYLAQGWAVFHLGQLAPYTYWYDHPPGGWIQLGFLAPLTAGFESPDASVAAGRILMLAYQLGAVALLYRVARGSGRSIMAATIAVLAFSLSAYGLYFHRRVLLDNIAAFWLLVALLPLVSRRVTLTRVWLSAIALGIGLLSKEIDVIVAPAMALLVAVRVDPRHRLIGVVGWLGVVGGFGLSWILLAILKGELFPYGTALGGASAHVSLLGTLQSQAARGADGGLLQATSGFWERASTWARADPVLVIGGTIGAFGAVLGIRRNRIAAIFGLMALSLWAFLGRGGTTLPFYLVPLLPILALQLAWLFDTAMAGLRRAAEEAGSPARGHRIAGLTLAGCLLLGTVVGYSDPALGFANSPTQLWSGHPGTSQREAIAWIRSSIPPESGIVADMYAWLDLQQPPGSEPRYQFAHYYWKADQDPEIRDGVFSNDWHRVDYLVLTPQADGDAVYLPFLKATLDHADILASFGNGDWPVIIERTRTPKSMSAASDTLLQRQWHAWNPVLDQDQRDVVPGPSGEVQALGLLAATYMDDRAAFDQSWSRMSSQARKNGGLVGPRVDTDVALALAFASAKWNEPTFRAAAKQIVTAIWAHETVAFKGGRLVVPAASARKGPIVVDLSAISPAAYRVFAAIDPAHEWGQVVDVSYRFLAEVQRQKATGGRIGLFPRWAAVEPATGNVIAISAPGGKENLFDAAASQVGWRVGLDWLWNRDERARRVLERLSLPGQELARKSWLGRAYHLDGQPIDGLNTVATYTTSLPPILLSGDPELASSAFTKFVLAPVVAPDFEMPVGPRDRAWAWFGTALMDGGLVDLTRPADRIDWSAVPGVGP
jgi:hypothetical protein